jgi:branched-chain amino acid transport system ATP-binding protein
MDQESFNKTTLLDVGTLEVTYDHIAVAIQGVSFNVPENQIVGLLGINGAGKTTTLRAISGFLGLDNAEISNGYIEFGGRRINGKKPHEISSLGIILVPEREKIFETLTTRENLLFNITSGQEGQRLLDLIYQRFPVLYQRRNKTAGYLSGGERQMLAIGKAIVSRARLLMIDEMSLGLSPKLVLELVESICELKRELALTILVVEQNIPIALDFIDYGYIMENGRIVYDGDPKRLREQEDVQEFYLGLKAGEEKSYRDVKQYRRTRRWWG